MERWFEMIFDLKKIPVKLVFVVWICATIILVLPESSLTTLNLDEFLKTYGKYLGIIFIICSALLFVSILTSIIHAIDIRMTKRKYGHIITDNLKQLDPSERALLREFYLQNQNTLQMPMDNPTVVGLASKRIIYQVSDIGFVYLHGSYYSYAITGYAKENLTNELIDLPRSFTDNDIERIRNSRPTWVNNGAF